MIRSEETRKKMSEAHKGKKHTEASKRKMSKSHKGKKHTMETRKLLSLLRKQYAKKKGAR
jgi:hypothetical protein